MRGRDPVILERDKELATLAAAIAGASTGHGTFVLVEGPAGIGKTTLLRTACQRPRRGWGPGAHRARARAGT